MKYEAKLYVNATDYLDTLTLVNFSSFPLYIIFGTTSQLLDVLKINLDIIESHYLEINYKKKLMDYYDLENTNARVEAGSIIRSGVILSDKAIVLMGAIINTNAIIGDYTMIDMNAVVGSGVKIGNNCHIGAGAVIAGVMEPVSSKNVVIDDDVFIGANATVLAGVKIGKGSIVGAGSVVREDVGEYMTVAGVPAKVVNKNQEWIINKDLR